MSSAKATSCTFVSMSEMQSVHASAQRAGDSSIKPPTWAAQVLVGLTLLCFLPAAALAQMSKRDFVKEVEPWLWSIEIFPGYSAHRCATAAVVSTNAYVTHIRNPGSQLELGDQIVAMDGQPLKQGTLNPLINSLSTIGPDDEIVLTILRQGERIDIPTKCTDSRALYSPKWDVYRAIVDKDFDECLERIPALDSAYGGVIPSVMHLQNHCMLYANRISRSDWSRILYEYYQLLIEEARWDPEDYEQVRSTIAGSENYFRQRGQYQLFENLGLQLGASRPTTTPAN